MSEAAGGRPRAAFQGAFGAFSHEACLACLPQAEPTPYPTFQAALEAVRRGDCAYAFTPVENVIAGPVPEMTALLPSSGLVTRAEHRWPVRIQLMGNPGTRLDQVRVVASHPMALGQCRRFLAAHDLAAEEAYDTAGAAADLAARPDPARAAAAPRPAAALYGLELLAEDIQDDPGNFTRFLVLARP